MARFLTRTFIKFAILACCMAGLALILIQRSSTREIVSGTHYRGMLNGSPVSLYLPNNTSGGEGRFYHHLDGQLRYFDADRNGSPWPLEGKTHGGWLSLLGQSNGLCRASWSAESNGPQSFLLLERVADNIVYSRSNAVFVGRGMLRKGYLAERPAMPEPCNAELREADRRTAAKFVGIDWEEAWNEIRQGDGTAGAEGFVRRNVVFCSSNAISLLELCYQYTGGAHGMSFFSGCSWYREGSQWRTLKLADLFMPETKWKTRLGELAKAGLVQQGASGYVNEDGKASQTELVINGEESFTVNGLGVTLHYSPYQVASYAEGAFGVFIPFDRLREYLNPVGPLGCFRQPGDPQTPN